MPSLKSIQLGVASFVKCSRFVLESGPSRSRLCLDLPELESVHIGRDGCAFDEDETESELIMRSGESHLL